MPRCCFIFRASSTVANYWEMTEHLHHVIQHQIHHCEVTLRRDGAEGSSWQFKFRVQLTSCLGSKVLWMSKRGPSLAGRIVSLVVVPGVLVAIVAILWLLETNHSHRKNQWEEERERSVILCFWPSASKSGLIPGTSCCTLHIQPALPPHRHHPPQAAVWLWGPVAQRAGFLQTHPHWNCRPLCAASQGRHR